MFRSKAGFTLIEMMFVLSIILIITSLTFTFHRPVIACDTQIALVSNMFHYARARAMDRHQTYKVACFDDEVEVSSEGDSKVAKLQRGYRFLTTYSFTYNASGRIKTAKTLKLKANNKVIDFVFQLGSGTFYVRKR